MLESSAATGPAMPTDEMQRELTRFQRRLAELPDMSNLPMAAARKLGESIHAMWNVDLPEMDDVRVAAVPADHSLRAAGSRARIYRPKRLEAGRILFVHGGGWCHGAPETHDRFMRALAERSRAEVVGVSYRLAPENPFPAGLMDVVCAYRTLITSPQSLGLHAAPLVIGGDSAGANLALAAMIHEAMNSRPLPVGALLLYGAYSLDSTTTSHRLYGEGYWLTTQGMKQCWDWYLPEPGMRENPLAVPLLSPDRLLQALPPVFLLAAEIDVLTDDTLELKARLDRLGRADSLHIEPGVMHGYLQMTSVLEAARSSTALVAEAARRFLNNV